MLADSVPTRRPNLAPDFLGALSKALGGASLSPEEVFGYIYAMLYSPSYRSHYGDFLKRDFPRVPLPHSAVMFARLAVLGHELMKLHLLKKVEPVITRYPKAGSNRVEKVEFKPDAADPTRGCVFINGAQFFEGVPTDVWEYAIGGYQVAHK
jgi:predicted helicase